MYHSSQFFKKSDSPKNDLELCRRESSSQFEKRELAVCVRNAHISYGIFRNTVKVLESLNMTVTRGDIYGLLGASGCGKTTLLNCILGRKRLNSGRIWVLGGRPGSKSSGVPGPRVGYMPQATALYGEFTASETLYFYGWIAGMTNDEIKQRSEVLKSLLMLPDTKQLVKDFSGGQQRRVSLAAALLNEPELLVLDEPTVGLDPVLREAIWEHLLQITNDRKVTIIITTHYIEEARQAHIVGLMRGGRLLAEEQPEKLIARYGAQTLEEVFLSLSIKQNANYYSGSKRNIASNKIDIIDTNNRNEPENIFLPDVPAENGYVRELSDYLPNFKLRHLKAFVWKGYLWMMRNLVAMFCIIMIPVTQIPVFCIAVGNDPVDLRVAVINYETNNTVACNHTISCYSDQLSCAYLRYLEERALNLIYFDSEDDAVESVLRGTNYASVVISHNYSAALRNRVDKWDATKPWDMTASEINVFRDLTNKHIAVQLKVYLYDTFLRFVQDFVESCDIDRRILKLPIEWQTPVYGAHYPNFTDYVLPGLLVVLTFFLAVAATSFGILIERNEASFERTFVIGISEIELLGGHIICQFSITASQMVMSLVCAFLIFDMTHNGSMVLVVVHILLTGFLGMCYGLLVSCMCDHEQTAAYLALGSVLPMFFLGGVAWPVEAMHPLLQIVAYFSPLTLPTESLRSILQRGWGIYYKTVYLGFLTLSAWAIIFLIVSVLFLKLKKY